MFPNIVSTEKASVQEAAPMKAKLIKLIWRLLFLSKLVN